MFYLGMEQNEIKEIKEENFFIKLWNKTVFPDMLKERKEKKLFENKIKKEAYKEAMQDLKPELVKAIKEQEKNKILGIKKPVNNKIANAFNFDTSNKIDKMLGTEQNINQNTNKNYNKNNNQESFEDKVKRMLK